jgi:hypothetical protein
MIFKFYKNDFINKIRFLKEDLYLRKFRDPVWIWIGAGALMGILLSCVHKKRDGIILEGNPRKEL